MDRWRSRTRAPAEGASPLPWRCILETHVQQLFFSISSFRCVLDSACLGAVGTVFLHPSPPQLDDGKQSAVQPSRARACLSLSA